MPGLLKRIWSATEKMKDEAKQRRVEKKLRRSFDAAADDLDGQRDKARAKIEAMLSLEELLKLDDGKNFDVNEYRRLRNEIRTCDKNIAEVNEAIAELFDVAPDDLSDIQTVEPEAGLNK